MTGFAKGLAVGLAEGLKEGFAVGLAIGLAVGLRVGFLGTVTAVSFFSGPEISAPGSFRSFSASLPEAT